MPQPRAISYTPEWMKSATARPVTLVPINLQEVQRIYEGGPEEVINFECKGKQGIHLGTAGNLNLDLKYVKHYIDDPETPVLSATSQKISYSFIVCLHIFAKAVEDMH